LRSVSLILLLAAAAQFSGCDKRDAQPASISLAVPPNLGVPPKTDSPPEPTASPDPFGLPTGTLVPVKLLSVVDSSYPYSGFLPAVTVENIKGTDGRIAIPAGSPVIVEPRTSNKVGAISEMTLGLYEVTVAKHQYPFTDGLTDAASMSCTEDGGKGPAHSSVHLQYGTRLDFKLDRPVKFK